MRDVNAPEVQTPAELGPTVADVARGPIVLVGSRRKVGQVAVLSLVFVVLGLWETQQKGTWFGIPVPFAGVMGLILGLLGAAAAIVLLVRPATLSFTTESLTFRTLFTTLDLRWSEVERFQAWRPASTRVTMVGYTRRRPPQTRAESLTRRLGCDGAIPDQFPLSTSALLALCEACHSRWG